MDIFSVCRVQGTDVEWEDVGEQSASFPQFLPPCHERPCETVGTLSWKRQSRLSKACRSIDLHLSKSRHKNGTISRLDRIADN